MGGRPGDRQVEESRSSERPQYLEGLGHTMMAALPHGSCVAPLNESLGAHGWMQRMKGITLSLR